MTVSLATRLLNTGLYVQMPFGHEADPSPVIIAVTDSWAVPLSRLPGGNTSKELSTSGIGGFSSGPSPSSAGLGLGEINWTGWSTRAMHLETSLPDGGGRVDRVPGS